MSTWGDMCRRAEGEEIRREDEFRPMTIDDLWEDILKGTRIPRSRMMEHPLNPEEIQGILGIL